MALIHHLGLMAESDVPDSTVDIWADAGWVEGPLPDEYRTPPDPQFIPAKPAPPEAPAPKTSKD